MCCCVPALLRADLNRPEDSMSSPGASEPYYVILNIYDVRIYIYTHT